VNQICESTDEDALGGDPGIFLDRDVAKAAAGVCVQHGISRRNFDQQVAVHESGHCTVSVLLGLPVAGCTIEFARGHYGLTWARNDYLQDTETVETICAELSPLMSNDRSDIAVELQNAGYSVISLLAGPIAEDLFCEARLPNTEHDEIEARAIAGLICRSATSVDAYIEFAKVEAVALLTDHADMVLAIAAALVAHRTLNADQIGKLLTIEN
jgi:hypothetical protein